MQSHKNRHDDVDYLRHHRRGIRRQFLISVVVLILLIIGTILAVLYGTGYRFGFQEGQPFVAKTGILAVKSSPEGAQVYLNDHLTAATNENLNLGPGEYKVRIVKDGFFPWEKIVRVEEKVVTEIDALLFPTAPKLESITATGVGSPALDPSSTKIAYTVKSQTARRNGVYVFDMAANPVLALQGTARQLADETLAPLSDSELRWSPDSLDLLATVSIPTGASTTYLLNAQDTNQTPRDVTTVLATELAGWERLANEKERSRFNSLRQNVRTMIQKNFSIISWSPDDTKILYQASTSAQLPTIINPRLLSINNTHTEVRNLNQGSIYVYDAKEDLNVKVADEINLSCLPEEVSTQNQNENIVLDEPEDEVVVEEIDPTTDLLTPLCSPPIRWFPDSEHLIHVEDGKIDIMEYDGSNRTTIYAGPFVDNYVFPWPNGSKIVILTNLNNPLSSPNLYTISLR